MADIFRDVVLGPSDISNDVAMASKRVTFQALHLQALLNSQDFKGAFGIPHRCIVLDLDSYESLSTSWHLPVKWTSANGQDQAATGIIKSLGAGDFGFLCCGQHFNGICCMLAMLSQSWIVTNHCPLLALSRS